MLRDAFRTAEDDGKSVWRSLAGAANEAGALSKRDLRAALAALGVNVTDTELGEVRRRWRRRG